MANTFTVLFRGAASTESTTLYTVPDGTKTLITTFVVTNTSPSSVNFTISAGGVEIAKDATVAANDTTIIEFKSLMLPTDTIDAFAYATTVNFYVTGLEIT